MTNMKKVLGAGLAIATMFGFAAYKQISTTNVTLQKRRETSKLRHMKFVTMPPKNMPSWHDIGGQG